MSAEMDRIQGRVTAQLDTLRRTRTELEGIDVRVTSPDGLVTVRLDGVCALVDLRLERAATRCDPAALGRSITATCGVAAREVMARRAAVVTRFHGEFAG
ncbi:YbaB/EbfC family nucleoid-associated protein [Tsukamurella soli]|uniref:YbaB/EbfC DNA-binding family protein n=1 Tax=Tsukamurella soli TaxID=644556 RepID=A0ABP8K3D2_9ACTN